MSACCANIVKTDISPPSAALPLCPCRQGVALCASYVQAGQARLPPWLRPRAVDLLDRTFHGLGHTGFPLSQPRGFGPELIEGHPLEFFMPAELGEHRAAAHDEQAAPGQVGRHHDDDDGALGKTAAEISGADEPVIELVGDALEDVGVVPHLKPDAERLQRPHAEKCQQSPLPDGHQASSQAGFAAPAGSLRNTLMSEHLFSGMSMCIILRAPSPAPYHQTWIVWAGGDKTLHGRMLMDLRFKDELALMPDLRHRLRRLRWFRMTFRSHARLVASTYGLRFEIDDAKLTRAFLDWVETMETKKDFAKVDRADFVIFAA